MQYKTPTQLQLIYLIAPLPLLLGTTHSLLLTGSYHNSFHVYDKNQKTEYELEASKISTKGKQIKSGSKSLTGKDSASSKDSKSTGGAAKKKGNDLNPDAIDFTKKVLHTAWHPSENIIAVGAGRNDDKWRWPQ
jgi:serine/threonine-protein phosphatase 2A regulatory subunit B